MKKVSLRVSALEDLREIGDFYDLQSPGLGDEAIADLLRVCEKLSELGGIHLHRDGFYRMVADGRFRHHVIYYMMEHGEVHDVAVQDHRRDPAGIAKRVAEQLPETPGRESV